MTSATLGGELSPSAFVRMSQHELDELFQRSAAGTIPTGVTQGTAILLPGTLTSRIFRAFVSLLVWKGKVFSAGELKNRISPFGILGIRARVSYDASWMDGKNAILIDYSQTSFLAQKIRDEIREVSPGLYLGKVWWGKTRVLDFALQAT